jgi:hypothetical protein
MQSMQVFTNSCEYQCALVGGFRLILAWAVLMPIFLTFAFWAAQEDLYLSDESYEQKGFHSPIDFDKKTKFSSYGSV